MKPVKILSVDDEMDLELLLTQYFRRKIRKGEYEFFLHITAWKHLPSC